MTAAEIADGAAKNEARYGAKHLASILLGPAASIALWFAHLSPDPQIDHALAITAFMVVYWIFEPIDHGITGLIGCYLFWALGVANFETAFSGFADSTPWFLFGAILLGEAASRSGLANRVGTMVMAFAGTSYASVLLNVI